MKACDSHPHSKSSLCQNWETAAQMSAGNGFWHVPELCLGIGGRMVAGLSQNSTREHASHPPEWMITGKLLNPCPGPASFTGLDIARKTKFSL